MNRIENQNLHIIASPLLFIGASWLAGSTRFIQYFPGASQKGLVLSAVLGSATVVGSELISEKFDLDRLICVVAGIALSAIVAPYAAKALNEGTKMTLQASLRFAVIEAAIVGGIKFIPPLHNGKPPKIDNDKPLKIDDVDILEAFQGISIKNGHQNVVQVLKPLEKQGFFKEKSQEKSKEAFREVMQHFGLGVTYVDAKGWDYDTKDSALDQSIFHWSRTDGVQHDIPRAANDAKRVHLFSAASQYNAAEAPSAYTPPIGKAMEKSANDHTQGPFAQRTNPVVFELVTAFLTHLGFNMMGNVLPSAGTTYTNGSAIQHGYLRPTNQNVRQLAHEMEKNFRNLEVPCYESHLPGRDQSVFLMLGAAPAIGYSFGLDKNSAECQKLQYYAYLANFTAQFKQSLHLLETNPEKEVVLHVTGTGLGVFGCSNEKFARAFLRAALEFQNHLKPSDQKRIHVQLESYNGTDALKAVGQDLLRLGEMKPRLG